VIKFVYCLRRLPHLSLEEFQRYWRETHGPIVRERARVLGIKRYVQVHTLDDPANELLRESRSGSEPYDGVAELWWESRDAMMQATASEEGQRAAAELLEDERNFIDFGRSALWLAEEHPIISGD
jgi:uncharacterized protein (TIGR02118 family)